MKSSSPGIVHSPNCTGSLSPSDLVPETALETRLDAIWNGYAYCIEFRTPLR
jgi:hypothetical protein